MTPTVAYHQIFSTQFEAVRQQETWRFNGAAMPMNPGDFDRGYILYAEPTSGPAPVVSKYQPVVYNEQTYTNRIVTNPTGQYISEAFSKQELDRIIADPISATMLNISKTLNRWRNDTFVKGIFGTAARRNADGTSTAITFPATSSYVVPATLTGGAFGQTGTGLTYDKILAGVQLLRDQGFDPDGTGFNTLYLICRYSDYMNLMASKDSAGNLIFAGRDFLGHAQSQNGDFSTKPRMSNRIPLMPGVEVILSDDSFGLTELQKTAGLNQTLTGGRRLPLFTPESFRWIEREISPLDLVQTKETVIGGYLLTWLGSASLTRVQEKGVVEIEVATSAS